MKLGHRLIWLIWSHFRHLQFLFCVSSYKSEIRQVMLLKNRLGPSVASYISNSVQILYIEASVGQGWPWMIHPNNSTSIKQHFVSGQQIRAVHRFVQRIRPAELRMLMMWLNQNQNQNNVYLVCRYIQVLIEMCHWWLFGCSSTGIDSRRYV